MTGHTTTVTEFHPKSEVTTAIIDVRLPTGETFTGPIVCGYYDDDESPELWIEQEGRRVQFPPSVFAEVQKQLKRAARLAKGDTQ